VTVYTADRAGGERSLTAIVAAMEEEVAPLRARLLGQRAAAVTGARVTLGALGAAPVALAVTGDGERNARRGLSAVLAALPVRRVIVVGVAGGLTAGLGVEALLVVERVIDETDGSLHAADAALTEAAARISGARRGVAVTAVRIADTADEKRRLFALAGARLAADRDGSNLPVVVDLESSVFAAVASRAGVPWMSLRAVSDPAAESVPALLNRSRDSGGAVLRRRVVVGLLTRPSDLRRLLALRDRVRACASGLARATALTVESLYTAEYTAERSVSAASAAKATLDLGDDLATRDT
jgi:nucleoside phosphorylase